MNNHKTYSRLAFAVLASATAVTIGCNDGPTQSTGVPIVAPPPAPPPPPPPPPPPAPPPSTAPWFGFVGTEAGGFVLIDGPPGTTSSYPMAINDASQVVGRVAYSGKDRAFIWSRADGMKDLGVLSGGGWSTATAINSKGQVAGYSSTSSGGRWRAFRWSAESGMVNLGMLPGGCVSATAHGINSDGDVVGECLVDAQSATMRPFLWTEAQGMQDLGTLSNDRDGGARAINDHGQVVGYSSPQSYYDDEWRAVLWTKVGDGSRLDDCPSSECSAYGAAINNRGDVAGNAFGSAFVWIRGGRSSRLGDLAVGNFSYANSINDAGQIVGNSFAPAAGSPMIAFTWTEGLGVRALPLLAGKTEMFATGINNKSEIVGYAR